MNKIIYLDAAASYQKSDSVIAAQVDFLRNHYANSGRGICANAMWTDDMIANVRRRVADFMNANAENIVFTHGTTDAMNQIARMLKLNSESVVAVSDLDHHSARLPFVMSGAGVVLCPLTNDLNIDKTKIPYADVLVLTAMSNVIGVAQDVAGIIQAARKQNPDVVVVVDCAQFVVHNKIDVREWGADFVCWSGHKIGADTGVGIMYIKNPNQFGPVNWGGGMVNKIRIDEVILNTYPDVFEAGTLPLTQIAGLGVAIDDIENNRPDLELIKYAYDALKNIAGIQILTRRDAALLSFVVDGMHVLDFGARIGARSVCVRVGNMCASWIHSWLGINGSVRISVGAYNTIDEIKQVIEYIKDIVK